MNIFNREKNCFFDKALYVILFKYNCSLFSHTGLKSSSSTGRQFFLTHYRFNIDFLLQQPTENKYKRTPWHLRTHFFVHIQKLKYTIDLLGKGNKFACMCMNSFLKLFYFIFVFLNKLSNNLITSDFFVVV